jgi:diguanylate cyclase (GGDEF)-like protein/PAS domain S-box-containing protein
VGESEDAGMKALGPLTEIAIEARPVETNPSLSLRPPTSLVVVSAAELYFGKHFGSIAISPPEIYLNHTLPNLSEWCVMKWQRYIPAVPGVAIAIPAMLLGGMIALWFAPGIFSYGSRSYSFGASFWGIAAFGFLSLMVVGLVVLNALAERRCLVERELLGAFLEHIPDNVFFKDRDSRFVRIGRAMANYVGLSDPEQAVGKTDSDIFSAEHASKALADEQEIIRTGQAKIGMEEKETWPDGHESWALTTKVPLNNRRGQIIGTMGIAHNITDRRQAELRVQYMALHDALTGLPNRVLLEDRLGQAIALACRNRKSVAVLMLDMDRFKNVNDSFGHFTGDRLLEAVSVRLQGCLRESDILARLGGDEFVIGIGMVPASRDIETVAQKVLATLDEPFQVEGHTLQISASIGISVYPADGENAEALIQYADAAMYEAKRRGSGMYCFFVPELTEATRRRQKLESDLHQACARGEFVLHYQPLVSVHFKRITGVEALLRWNHPEEGLIYPNEFIPQLEELGLMVEVGDWVLKTACIQNAAWQNEGLPPVRVSVNVSSQQFYRGNIVDSVKRALRETGLQPKWLELELTESLTLDESEATVKIMRDLTRIGVGISLDDFGTGWSSLSYLRKFPLNRIKIDRSFMRDVTSESAAEAVVSNILSLGHSLGIECVAEGVETRQQLDYLQRQRCSEMQGFLYSPALPGEDCGEMLRFGKPEFMSVPVAPVDRFYAEKPSPKLVC